jgi:hypothetical protein
MQRMGTKAAKTGDVAFAVFQRKDASEVDHSRHAINGIIRQALRECRYETHGLPLGPCKV